MNSVPLLVLEGFSATLGTQVVLSDIDLSLEQDGIDVLMGPFKSGKTTLVRTLAGLNDHNASFRSWGKRQMDRATTQGRAQPTLVQQHVATLQANVQGALLRHLRGSALPSPEARQTFIEKALAQANLSQLVQDIHAPMLDQALELQRAITILSYALTRPSLLLIDEPTYGLSDEGAEWLIDWLEQLGQRQRLLVVLNKQAHARRLAHRVILLGGGRVLAHQDAQRFFNNTRCDWIQQFVRTGSLPEVLPDRLQNDEPVSLPAPAPPASATPIVVTRQTPPPAPAPAATDRRTTVLPTLSPHGVAMASQVGTRQPATDNAQGPAGFQWIIPDRLAGCAAPGSQNALDEDLDQLSQLGIDHLISLTEKDLDQSALNRNGLKNIHLPVLDRETPSIAQTYMLMRRMQKLMDEGQTVAVHCQAGMGRTGTVLAAWLIREGGLSAGSAIDRIRTINKDYVQTPAQEQFLHELENDLLMRL